MKFTGERYMPTEAGEIRLEHVHRYAVALAWARGKRVLDVACGEGYGTRLLATVAESVEGVDISADAVAHAKAAYGTVANASFREASAASLPFDDRAFDLVVSFETLEHLAEQAEMIAEIRRVLKPDGLLVISSPNRPVYSHGGEFRNEFHVKELDHAELEALLRPRFPAIRYLGQRIAAGSLVQPLGAGSSPLEPWRDDGTELAPGLPAHDAPVYFIALCAANEALLPAPAASFVQASGEDLLERYRDHARWAARADQELERVRGLFAQLQAEHEKVTAWAKQSDEEARRVAGLFAQLQAEHEKVTAWAKQSDEEARRVAGLFTDLQAEHARIAAWAQDLDRQGAERLVQVAAGEAKVHSLDEALAGERTSHWDALARHERDLQALREDLQRVATRNQALDQETNALREDLAKARAEAGEAKAQADAMQATARAAESRAGESLARAEAAEVQAKALAESLERALADRRGADDAREAILVHARAEADAAKAQAATLAAEVAGLEGLANEHNRQLAAYANSLSWRITAPLRVVAGWALGAALPAWRMALAGALGAGRALLRLAVASEFDRRKLRGKAFERLPAFFRGTAFYASWQARQPEVAALASRLASGDAQLLGNLVARDDTSRRPRVSVVIPIYGQLDYTLRCIVSTLDVVSRTSFELIVVDDCSPDESVETLSALPAIGFVGNDANQGFIRTCNHGARVARGEFLLFLNNDTVVQPGWLDELALTFDDVPDCGLAGSALLYPDGRLQEAGGIIWSDGSGWNYGRLDDPSKPEYGYRRDVDYCSGASLMIRSDLFAQLGGFDEHYLPAYGEDSDLAFRVRKAGRRVLVQPRSRVIHFEGITSGTDLSQGAKAYQVANAKKLYERWKDVLADHGTPGENPHLARDRHITGRVLVIDHCTPTPDQDAGSITTLNLMRILQSFGLKVTFVPEDNLLYLPRYTTDLERAGIECLVWPHVPSLKHHLATLGHTYDAIVLFRVENAMRHLDDIELHCPQAKVIFHTSDLHFLRTERQAELEDSDFLRRHAATLKDQELSTIRRCAATIVHSAAEKTLLDDLLAWNEASRIFVHGWAIPIPGTKVPFRDRDGMVFVGGFQHTPNVDAVDWFVAEIFPHVRRRLPAARFLIVGSKAPERFAALGVEGVEFVGFVPDLQDVFDRCRLSVAPLRYGAGIKGKIYTSLSYGLPCASTAVGAEGMGLVPGEDVLVADAPEALAEQIVRLHEDEALWNRLQAGGFAHLHARASLEAGRVAMESLLAAVGLAGRARRVSKEAPGVPPPAEVLVDGPEAYQRHLDSDLAMRRRTHDHRALARLSRKRPFAHEGRCDVCGQPRAIFRVDESALPEPPETADPTVALDRQLACTICGLRSHERALAVALRRLGAARAPGSPLAALVIAQSAGLPAALPSYVANVRASFAAVPGPGAAPAGWRLAPADESVDAIACILPPECEAFLDELLGEMHRVLRAGGTLLLSAPPKASPDWALAERLRTGPWNAVVADLHWADATGHLGVGACHLRATRAGDGAYERRIERELARYEDVEVVHDLPAIFHYWSHNHLRPIFEDAGIESMERFFASNLLAAAGRTGSSAPRFLSIGSGNCDLEVNVALALRDLGAKDYTIECLELNPDMLERGREHAASHGMQQHVVFTRADFNAWTPSGLYDGIMANQSLHHVTRLEFLFEQVKAALHDDGAFVVSDIIGRNGHMRWPEALDAVNELWRDMPESHKYNHALRRTEAEYENWDCSTEGFEGVRAQDILPLLLSMFHFRTFVAFGNVIDIFVDRAFGPNFRTDEPADCALIDRAHRIDEEGFRTGRLTPTHLIAVLGKRPVAQPFHSRSLRPEDCVREPDLGRRPGTARAASGGSPATGTVVADRTGYEAFLASALAQGQREAEERTIRERAPGGESYAIEGLCEVCEAPRAFGVDITSGGERRADGLWVPNWRERCTCVSCRMNTRQRIIAARARDVVRARGDAGADVYLTEQLTPLFAWMQGVPGARCVGSEYLGPGATGGTLDAAGIRHEDVERLSFADSRFDLLISNDVLEHVNDPRAALREMWRVLRPGGVLLMTVPFHANLDAGIKRATIDGAGLVHHLPPVYHVNPISEDGSLVFTDFGWDFLGQVREAGFADVALHLYWDESKGYFGVGQHYIRAHRP